MPKAINITPGTKFARLTIVSEAPHTYARKFLCECECGNFTTVTLNALRNGHTRSCGCLHADVFTKHGYARKRVYRAWMNMKLRCTDPRNKSFADYGGRGIKVCERWMTFENFLADMGEPPNGLQIDRINNEGDYCSENCRWATKIQQTRNKRDNVIITVRGITACVAEIGERFGVNPSMIRQRMGYGWSAEDAVFKPRRKGDFTRKQNCKP